MTLESRRCVADSGSLETVTGIVAECAGMIQFMLLTGCRPAECDGQRSTRPKLSGSIPRKHHKTSHKGKKRLVMIGPKGQKILSSVREMSRSDFVFDPMTGLEEFIRKNYGDDARVRQTVGQHYSPFSLHAAIRKACDKAGVPCWSPGQLRKTRATNARQQADLETAQQVLGHSSKSTTERHYAVVDVSRAEVNALQFG